MPHPSHIRSSVLARTGASVVVRRRGPLAAILTCVAVAGCQCNIAEDDLDEIIDAGFDPVDAGPPPPKFPLKAGDQLRYPALGGRTATCPGSARPGDCDRAITADYVIDSVALGADNTWSVTAGVVYQGSTDVIEAAAIAPLILENVAPFAEITVAQPSRASGVAFKTNTPPTSTLDPLGFPFFQYDAENIDVFESAGEAFCASWRAMDPEANCRVQFGDQKMEVYYKNGPQLHKVRAEFHKMGFICGWEEALIPFEEGMERDQRSFPSVPELTAIFNTPIKLERDDVTYNCTCFSQTCKSGNGPEATCLTLDPDAPPGPCP